MNSVLWTAACRDCGHFTYDSTPQDRDKWAGEHSTATGHVVETGFQLP